MSKGVSWMRLGGRQHALVLVLLGTLAAPAPGLAADRANSAASIAHLSDAGAREQLVGSAPGSQPLELVLPLKADLAGLRRWASAVTTPGSGSYGEYQSIVSLARRFGASASKRRRVIAFLHAVGARNANVDPTGLFVDVRITAGLAQRLFATPLREFRADSNVRFIAPAAPAAAARLPAGLRGLVTGVVGLDARPLFSAPAVPGAAKRPPLAAHAASQQSSARPRSGTPAGCSRAIASGGFTPNQYLTAYGYDPLHHAGVTGQGERVALIEIDGFKYSDIRAFANCFALPVPELRAFGVGVSRPLRPGGESTLDLEVLDAAAPGLRSIDVYEVRSSAAATLAALTAPLRARREPQVISASLGLCEPALYQSVGRAGIALSEAALQIAAAGGITFLASSGDQGSADCTRADGSTLPLLAVNYPASSWWMTGVGGTNLVLNAANQIAAQLVWNDAGVQPGSAGGGGSSDLFGRPNYQRGTVASKRRAVPDVAMLADLVPGYAIYCSARGDCVNSSNNNPWQAVGGTSAATPLLAGGLALVDQQLRLQRRRDLGLLNPLLYSVGRTSAAASIFDDVTALGNDVGPYIGASSAPLGCCLAGRGYDRASGWGSVNLASFAAVALLAQPQIVSLRLSLLPRESPVRSRKLLAALSCSGPCLIEARAEVTIGHSRAFDVGSRVFRLGAMGERTVAMHFSARQLRRLRAALGSHQRVGATVYGVLLDPSVYGVLFDAGQAVQERTAGRTLTING